MFFINFFLCLTFLVNKVFADLDDGLYYKYTFESPSPAAEKSHNYPTNTYGSLTFTTPGAVGSSALNVSAGYLGMPDFGPGSFKIRTAVTMAAWVKLYSPIPSQASIPTIVMRRDWCALRWQNDNSVEPYPPATSGQLLLELWNYNGLSTTGITWPVNQWFHVAGSYDQSFGKMQIYYNGILNNEKSFSGTIGYGGSDNSDPFWIGRDGTIPVLVSGTRLNGELDDVRLYNRRLSPDEILQLATMQTSPTASPTSPFSSCYDGFYCDGDIDAVRGTFTNAQDCYDACVGQGSSLGKDYKFFDVTTDSQQSCWCGETCNARVPYATTGYSMHGGRCLTDAPTFAPTVTPSLRPSQPPTEYPTQSPTHPTESPSEAPSDSPTLSPSAAPTASPTTSEPTEEPTLTPSQAPTNTYSFCSEGLYCDGDVSAMRGLFTAAQCYDRCTSLNQGFKFFDVTDQGQCWCGKTCDSFLPFTTTGYRMDAGVCPAGTHVNTETPTVAPSTASRRLRIRDED